MPKTKNQRLIEQVMANSGASANAVLKVVGELKEMEADDVDLLLGRKKPKVLESKEFRTSGSEEAEG